MAQKYIRKITVTHTYYEVVESTAGRAEFIEKDVKKRWQFEEGKPSTDVIEPWRSANEVEDLMTQRIDPEHVR